MEFLRQAVRVSDQRMGRVESSMARKKFWTGDPRSSRIFSRFQLSVDMTKGKTEVMLALRGKNATTEREKLRDADGLRLDIDDDERLVHCNVHVVSEYKHLGTWVS